jgi:hypothetical protein
MRPHYLSYLLRIWKAGGSESPTWVASLETPHTHEMQQFNNLDSLYQFLQKQIALDNDSEDEDSDSQNG